MDKITQGKTIKGSEFVTKVNCSMCKKEGLVDQFFTFQDNKGQNAYLCQECKQKTSQAFEDETKNPNILLAIVVGVVSAVIGGIIWYLVAIGAGIEIGYISIGLGYIIGYGVYLGSGKKRGQQLQIISALIALVAIIVIEKFIFDYFLNEYIRSNPAEFPNLPTGQRVSISFSEPEFWKGLVSPVGLLIYAIGIYIAYMFPKPRKI